MDVTISCVCPGETARHPSGDTVSLRERLDPHAAITIRKAIGLLQLEDPDASSAEILAILTEHYVLFGVEAWTLRNAEGKPLEMNRPNIRGFLLSRVEDITPLVDAADALYAQQVLLPLLARASTSTATTPTPSADDSSSTSAPTALSTKKRGSTSKPSSTSTSTTVGTAVTSSTLEYDSNSSPSSQSAA